MIDLCVVNFNTKDKLDRLIKSLEVGPNNFSLYIADNGSTDGSVEYLENLHANYRCDILLNGNIGYSAACNQLASMGQSPIIGLLNADVWMTGYDVDAIYKSFIDNPEQDIMGPKQRDEEGRVTAAGIFGSNKKPEMRGWKQPDPDDSLYRDRLEAVTISGSAYFIRRSVWEFLTDCPNYLQWMLSRKNNEPIGAFLPTEHYYEETFCSYHATHHGYRIFYDGSVSCGHSWHASSKIGGEADQKFRTSQAIFRDACYYHGIPHD